MRGSIIIIGAGLAGLSVGNQLAGKDFQTIDIFEARSTIGGRIRTYRTTEHGPTILEQGPWRIAATHHRMLTLIKRLGLTYHPTGESFRKVGRSITSRPGLSIWDTYADSEKGPRPAYADQRDRATGYPGQTAAASGSSPYTTSAKIYYIVPAGLDSIPKRLAEEFRQQKHTALHLGKKVTNIERMTNGYEITWSQKTTEGYFLTGKNQAQFVIVCVPPRAWRDWDIYAECRTTLAAVDSSSLYHVYVRDTNITAHTLNNTGQQIPSQYKNKWAQKVYTAGRLADFWYRLRLAEPETFRIRLGLPRSDDDDVKDYYWPHAFHFWRPVVGFSKKQAVTHSVYPNPTLCPDLYFANESHSSHQAWMEGALEMADLVVQRLLDPQPITELKKPPVTWVIIDGWVVDVGKWINVHPGTRKALVNHLNEDVTKLINHSGHSQVALATIHSLKYSPMRVMEQPGTKVGGTSAVP